MNEKTKISSYGQSGGITAHTVNSKNVGGSRQNSRMPKWRRWLVIAGALLAAAASAAAVLEFFDVGPWGIGMKDKRVTEIKSINQSGGITAHTVNVGAQRRQMTEKDGAQIKDVIPTDAQVTVATVFGDSEAFAFAIQVREWLLKNGYAEVKGVNEYGGLAVPIFGQEISKTKDGYQIFIGSRE